MSGFLISFGFRYGDLFPNFYRMHDFRCSFHASSGTIDGLDSFFEYFEISRLRSTQSLKSQSEAKQPVVRCLNATTFAD